MHPWAEDLGAVQEKEADIVLDFTDHGYMRHCQVGSASLLPTLVDLGLKSKQFYAGEVGRPVVNE